MSSVITLPDDNSVSIGSFTTDCLRHFFRICGFSYHTLDSFDYWSVDDRKLGYIYHRNLPVFPLADLMLTPAQLTKQKITTKRASGAIPEQSAGGTSASDHDDASDA